MKTAEQIKADMISAKLNQVNAAAEKHAAALAALLSDIANAAGNRADIELPAGANYCAAAE